jgi:urease accessory protein
MKNGLSFVLLTALCLFAPGLAHAHPGHAGPGDFAHGLIHPLTGWDHLLAIFAVSLWSAQLGGRALWLLPAVFIGGMGLGNFVLAAVPPALVAAGLAGSLLVLGLLGAAAAQLPLTRSIAIVGGFALFHGGAHAARMSATEDGFAYTLGLVGTSAMVLGVLAILAHLAPENARTAPVRWAGAAIAVAGVLLGWQ